MTRPSKDELYGALVELQSSAADYVRELEGENRRLREALTKIRDNDPDGWEASIARAALATEPASGKAQGRIVLFNEDHGVCIGGRWDGWIMRKHPDGQWVSVNKPDHESLQR